MTGAKDVGNAASAKEDKRPFEFEASLFVNVPLQRRKARGKQRAIEAKLAQLAAKEQFTREKVAAEVESAVIALVNAYRTIDQARESLRLARKMEQAERRKLELGDSNLLLVNLREQATADAAANLVAAREAYFKARADYRAVLGAAPTADLPVAPPSGTAPSPAE